MSAAILVPIIAGARHGSHTRVEADTKWRPSNSDTVEWVGTTLHYSTRSMTTAFLDLEHYYQTELTGMVAKREPCKGMRSILTLVKRSEGAKGYVSETYGHQAFVKDYPDPIRIENSEAIFTIFGDEKKITARLNLMPATVKTAIGNDEWWENAVEVRGCYEQGLDGTNADEHLLFFDKRVEDNDGNVGSESTLGNRNFYTCGLTYASGTN